MNDYVLHGNPGWGSALVEAQLDGYGLPWRYQASGDLFASAEARERLRRLNPLSQVPVLELPDGTVMTESAAITLHLADRTGRDDFVPGPQAPERAAFLRWLVFLVANVYPTFTYADEPTRYVKDEAAAKAFRAEVDAYAQRLWLAVEGCSRRALVPGRTLLGDRHLPGGDDALAAAPRLVCAARAAAACRRAARRGPAGAQRHAGAQLSAAGLNGHQGVIRYLSPVARLGVTGDRRRAQRLGQAHAVAVVAGEGGRQLGGHALLERRQHLRPQLGQVRKDQPAADAPGKAEAAPDLGRPGIQAAVEVDLLVHVAAVAAVGRAGLAQQRRFHRGQDLGRQRAAAGGVEAQRGAGGGHRLGQALGVVGRAAVDHVLRALPLQQRHLGRRAHDADESEAVGQRDAVEHLPEVGRRRRVHDGTVAFVAHRLHEAQRGQRVDEARGPLLGAGARGQQQAGVGPGHAVLRIQGTAHHGHAAAQQRLRGRRSPGRHHGAGALVAHRQRLAHAPGHRRHGRAGTRARTCGRPAVPPTSSVPRSAAPNSRPMSLGLMGVASTRISTSSSAGTGSGSSCSASSSWPSAVIRDRSCRVVVMVEA
jgi:GST-like protein